MWYVVHVSTGREAAACRLIEERVDPSLYAECFVPRRSVAHRVGDTWSTVEEPLFPGYLIVDTAQPRRLRAALDRLPDFARLLDVDGEFLPLVGKEAQVKRINRRKRRAVLELRILGRVAEVPVGLEILRKPR